MASYIKLVIWKKGSNITSDISNLVQKIVWAGKDSSPARSIDVTLKDTVDSDRAKINVIDGYQCLFKWKGTELFRGIIMKTSQSSKGTMTFKAYDVGIYLSNNKDAFNYKKKTAHYIFNDVCKRYGIPVDKCCTCRKNISEISKVTSGWDVIQTALEEDFDSYGIRHAVTAFGGKVSLTERRENIVKWLLESDNNIISWTYTNSIEKVKTRIKLYSSKNKTLATAKDKSLESKIGILQDVNKPDESETKKGNLRALAESILKEEKKPERLLNIQALGIISMRTGRGAFVIIPEVNLNKSFYITSDTHTFEGDNKHTMSLQLKKATDLKY